MSEPAPFPEFFVNGLLREAKWPREAGLFKKKWVVDPRVVDFTCFQLAELAVTLGAKRPRLATQLLADIFRERDWDVMPFSELLPDLDPTPRILAAPEQRPWHAIVTMRLAQDGDLMKEQLIPWELLAHRNFRAELSIVCGAGLVWGLLHPEDAIDAIEKQNARYEANMPMWRKAGLALDPGFSAGTAEKAAVAGAEMLDAYQSERRPLVPVPAALADSPELRTRMTRSPSDENQRNGLLAFIRHCQFLLASQQLTMELFNDGLERAADSMAAGDELFVRSYGGVSSPELASEFILPALQEKVAILKTVQSTHEAVRAGIPRSSRTYKTSELLSEAIGIWVARGRVQLECWADWAEDPSMDLSSRMANLDNSETTATGIMLTELNGLIEEAQLTRSGFLEINRQAFNLVRARRQLTPLSETEFDRVYASGRAGGRARFFSD